MKHWIQHLLRRLKCSTGDHMWVEWEVSDRPRHHFIYMTTMLKNPYCADCGVKRFNKKEAKAYEKRQREQLKAAGYALTDSERKRIENNPHDRRWNHW